MPFADLHCDTIDRIADSGLSLRDGAGLQLTLDKLRVAGSVLQCFALFVDLRRWPDPWARFLTLADAYDRAVAANADRLCPVLAPADLDRARGTGRIASVLTIEEGGVFGGDLGRLRQAHRRGVRLVTLTWNHPNGLAAPNGRPGGLTETGRQVLHELERLRMAVDVSHLGDDGFWDVARLARRPFCASHSSARALCDHPRDLTDPMLRAVADSGGVVGVNFYAPFVGTSPVTRTEDLVRHVRHLLDVAGTGAVALGSDFDGIDCELELGDAAGLPLLARALRRSGLSEEVVERVCWRNAWDYFSRVL